MTNDNVLAFPQIYGEALDEALMDRVSEMYGISNFLLWAAVRTGDEPSYLLRADNGDYILRRCAPDRAAGSLVFELNLTKYLQEHAYPVLHFLPTRMGSHYFRHDGVFYTLAASKQGELFDFFEFEDEEHLLAAARGLAEYHKIVMGYPGPFCISSTPYLSDQVAGSRRVLAEIRASMAPRQAKLRKALESVAGQIDELSATLSALYRRETKIVAHGSFDDRALWFDSGRLVCVDNFSHADLDLRLTDVAQSLVALCSQGRSHLDAPWMSLDCGRSTVFLQAYGETAPLSEEDLQAISALLRARQLVENLNDCTKSLHGDSKDVRAERAAAIESRLTELCQSKQEATDLVTAWTA
jgi:Ser/Thr protein kinase RdoA (MazF antagonist)